MDGPRNHPRAGPDSAPGANACSAASSGSGCAEALRLAREPVSGAEPASGHAEPLRDDRQARRYAAGTQSVEVHSAAALRAHLCGDRAAFAEFVRLTEPTVRVNIWRILDGRAARVDSDDVVQRVWLGVLNRPRSPQRRLVGWLVRLAKREALLTAGYGDSERTKPRARADRRSIGGIALTAGLVDCSPLPDELAEQRRTLRRLRSELRMLPLAERAAFVLNVLEGEPSGDGSTQRVYVNRARAKLRRVV